MPSTQPATGTDQIADPVAVPHDERPFRGIVIASALSLPIWALLISGATRLF